MKSAKTLFLSTARWLVVFTMCFVMLAGNVFASMPSPVTAQCESSCAVKCPCCIKSAPNSPAPLAPVSSTGTTILKDFQLIAAVAYALPRADQESACFCSTSALPLCSASTPLFLRHRALLI
jgi:hypothetical protein